MKQIVLLGLLLLSAVHAVGLAQNVDSLVNILETRKLSTNEQMNIYSKICHSFVYNNPEKVVEFALKGLNLAEKEKNKVWASKFNNYAGQANTTKAQFDTAFVYFNKSLALAVEANDKEQEARVYINLGLLSGMQGNLTTSLEYYMKALAIFENTGSKKDCAKVLSSIANIHNTLKNPERALHYALQAEAIAEYVDDPIVKISTYYTLGNIYIGSSEKDKGLKYFVQVNEISRTTGNKAYEAASAQAISVYYMYMENDDKAIEYANESLRIGKEINDQRHIIGAYCTLSDIYGDREKWKECEATAGEVWKMIDPMDMHYAPGILYKLILSNIYLNNKDKAASYLTDYKSLLERSNDENFHEILIDMEVKYETEKKEMRIASLEKERQLYVWLGVAGLLLILAMLLVLWQTLRNTRKEKQLIAVHSVLDGEMGERSRLARDLHDRLSGNLSAIKIGLGDNKESFRNIHDKLDSCIEEIRRVAHNLMPVSLQLGLKIALEDFAAQFPDVHFHFFGDEHSIDKRKAFVVYCCAVELVNNSLRHSGAKNINIQLIQGEKYVSLTIQDDGCGFDEKSVTKGIGLKNIHDRVTSCNGQIDIATSPGKGTEITIDLKTGDI